MENKSVEFIKDNKKVIISSVAVGVVLVLGFGWYSYYQHQAEQQAKIVQLEKDSKSDKEQVDKLFESFDASSDESISKLKELSETSLKTDTGKDYLNNKVKESSKAIVDFHLQKGLAYDIKDSDDKFKDKTTIENNVKETQKFENGKLVVTQKQESVISIAAPKPAKASVSYYLGSKNSHGIGFNYNVSKNLTINALYIDNKSYIGITVPIGNMNSTTKTQGVDKKEGK